VGNFPHVAPVHVDVVVLLLLLVEKGKDRLGKEEGDKGYMTK